MAHFHPWSGNHLLATATPHLRNSFPLAWSSTTFLSSECSIGLSCIRHLPTAESTSPGGHALHLKNSSTEFRPLTVTAGIVSSLNESIEAKRKALSRRLQKTPIWLACPNTCKSYKRSKIIRISRLRLFCICHHETQPAATTGLCYAGTREPLR